MEQPIPKKTSIKQVLSEKKASMSAHIIQVSQADLVRYETLQAEQGLPLVLRPTMPDFQLADWMLDHQNEVHRLLLSHGGLLFRGFAMRSQVDFEQFLQTIQAPLLDYMEGATPRRELSKHIYTSTIFPQEQHIALHNELSYVQSWPPRIWFFCVKAAEEGGETPVADVRRVYQRIPITIRERFAKKGWMLVRNFSEGISLPWQTSFRTQEKEEVEAYCQTADIIWEWLDDHHLRTYQRRSAIAHHPDTGEAVWFNHIAFWHISRLNAEFRSAFLAEYDEADLPYNTFYGDGTPIESEVIDEIDAAYQQETVIFPWQPGDMLMLDNMLVAHGRRPFHGSRNILTAMSDTYIRP